MIEQWHGADNEWAPFAEKMEHHVEQCSGVESNEPSIFFKDDRLVMSFDLNKDMLNFEDLCDSEYFGKLNDPRIVFT
jgi:hypothetical protein